MWAICVAVPQSTCREHGVVSTTAVPPAPWLPSPLGPMALLLIQRKGASSWPRQGLSTRMVTTDITLTWAVCSQSVFFRECTADICWSLRMCLFCFGNWGNLHCAIWGPLKGGPKDGWWP